MQVMALQPEPRRQRTFAWMGSAGTWEGGSKGCNLTNGRRISSKPRRVKSDISSNLGNEGKPRHLRRSEGTARNRRYSGEGIVHTQNAGWSNGAGNAEQGHEFPHFSASNVGPPYKLLTKVDAAMRKELTCLGVSLNYVLRIVGWCESSSLQRNHRGAQVKSETELLGHSCPHLRTNALA